MALLDKLKSLLGRESRERPPSTGSVSVTVEHEPGDSEPQTETEEAATGVQVTRPSAGETERGRAPAQPRRDEAREPSTEIDTGSEPDTEQKPVVEIPDAEEMGPDSETSDSASTSEPDGPVEIPDAEAFGREEPEEGDQVDDEQAEPVDETPAETAEAEAETPAEQAEVETEAGQADGETEEPASVEPESAEPASAEPESPEPEPAEPEESAGEQAPDATQESAGEQAPDATQESTDTIKGIGNAYAGRLADAGVETVGDLAAADPAELAEEADISESRLERWVERAKDQ